jgi:hypothetical protein
MRDDFDIKIDETKTRFLVLLTLGGERLGGKQD